MASSISRPAWDDPARGRAFALWVGVLAGPLLFLTLLQVNYVLSYVACEMHRTWFLHVTTVVACLLTGLAGMRAWHSRARPELEDATEAATGMVYAPRSRVEWMAHLAVLSSAWFIIAMLAFLVPVVVLRPCH